MMFFALRKMMLLVLLAMMRCLQITLGEADIISEGNIIKKVTFVLVDKSDFIVGSPSLARSGDIRFNNVSQASHTSLSCGAEHAAFRKAKPPNVGLCSTC